MEYGTQIAYGHRAPLVDEHRVRPDGSRRSTAGKMLGAGGGSAAVGVHIAVRWEERRETSESRQT